MMGPVFAAVFGVVLAFVVIHVKNILRTRMMTWQSNRNKCTSQKYIGLCIYIYTI